MKDQRKDKQQERLERTSRRFMSEDPAVQEAMDTVSASRRQSKESWYHQKYRKTRKCIEDMKISQFEVEIEVGKKQGVSLGADKRELKDWPETVPTTTSKISK